MSKTLIPVLSGAERLAGPLGKAVVGGDSLPLEGAGMGLASTKQPSSSSQAYRTYFKQSSALPAVLQ